MQRSGVVKRVQRAYNKRVRRHAKAEINKEFIELTEEESDSFYDMMEEINEPSEEFQRACEAYRKMTKEDSK